MEIVATDDKGGLRRANLSEDCRSLTLSGGELPRYLQTRSGVYELDRDSGIGLYTLRFSWVLPEGDSGMPVEESEEVEEGDRDPFSPEVPLGQESDLLLAQGELPAEAV